MEHIRRDDINNLYKPFRNKLRKYNVLDSLYLIWGYARNYTFDFEFPPDIERPANFNPLEKNKQDRKYFGLFDHELDFLLKECIINCGISRPTKTLRQKDELKNVVNYLRHTLNEEIDKKYTIADNFLLEFNRMAHRQFIWQLHYSDQTLFRYFKIYSNETLSKYLHEKFNLTPYQLYQTGIFLFSWTASHFRTKLPFTSQAKAISTEMLESFIKHFSISFEQAQIELKSFQQINENIFYTYNPLIAKPLILNEGTLLCPLPILIYWQITWGLYYAIVDDQKGFAEAYGEAFQTFIGEVINSSVTNNDLKILAEEKYKSGKLEKRTTDWIITDEKSIIFIECKTKRMTLVSKTQLDPSIGLKADLEKFASFILQLYSTYIDYVNNLYPQIKYDPNKQFYPIVLTLEEWHININPTIQDMLRQIVLEGFQKKI